MARDFAATDDSMIQGASPMAMDAGSSRGGLNSNINVTPLVDVMLVLLIIMMLIAPMLQKGVPVTLPQANNGEQKPDTQDQTVVSIDSQEPVLGQRPAGTRRKSSPTR